MTNDFDDIYNGLDRGTRNTLDSMISRSEDYADLAEKVTSYDGDDRSDLVRATAALDESEISPNEMLGGLSLGRSDYEHDLTALDRSRTGL